MGSSPLDLRVFTSHRDTNHAEPMSGLKDFIAFHKVHAVVPSLTALALDMHFLAQDDR
jgi:hypothetical protein